MRGNLLKKEIIFGIIILMISTSLMPVLAGNNTQSSAEQNVTSTPVTTLEKTTTITFYVFEKTKLEKHTMTISIQNATTINIQFQELKKELAAHPYNEQTQQREQQFLNLLEEKHALPTSISTQELNTLLQPPNIRTQPLRKGILPLQGRSSEWFCNFATTGTGSAFPIIILPRLIPFILTPIPRIFVMWSTPEGITSVGGLISHTGFIAEGQQKGLALGFWGIGFSIFLPPIDAYGIFGYALFARVTADYMEFWPPNNPPEITQTDPADGQQFVPITTTELRFSIYDADKKDLMSYNVTTDPDIGSGSGGLKPNGIYSLPISGLESLTNYTWHITVTDGKDTTEKTLRFTTEPIAPIVSNPLPADGARDVPMDTPKLQFTIKDYQGDAMEYTVQTQPNIGSDHKVGVHDGTYTVPVSGMTYGATYRWYVNVTDGTHWTRKVFSFETGYPSQFDPFEFGWHYQKQITINHSQVTEDLQKISILISTIDPDLTKAQNNGGDILFMNGTGVAKRQYHEIETFDQTTGTLVAWVNIPALSSSQDTVFYLYYGNPTCIDQQHPAQTWNSHYQAVWHLSNNPAGTIIDSTANSNDGTSHGSMTSSDLVDGKTGKCLEFDGINDYISVPDSSSLKPMDLTLVAWFHPQQGNLPQGDFLAKACYDYWDNSAGQTYAFYLDPSQIIHGVFEKNTYDQVDGIGAYPITAENWYYLTLTFEKSTGIGNFYVNGVLQGTKNCDSSVLWYNNPWDFTMGGCRWNGGSEQVINTFFNCGLDEIRVMNIPVDAGWIATEYANQNNPAGFCTIGPEVPGP